MFDHNHTEAGEAKGGAAAAAAEVNRYLNTSAQLHHILNRFPPEVPELFTLLTLCGPFYLRLKVLVSAAISSFLLASRIFHDRGIH